MRQKLITCTLILFTSLLWVATANAGEAANKHHARHVARQTAAPAPGPAIDEPARMVEVRPGLIISSYGCITDEGYGRWLPCGGGKR